MDEPQRSESTKPFDISKREVWQAYQKVKDNKGAPGVDKVSLEEFEKDLKNQLYQIWNRMSSGSYFPPPVKAVLIPKKGGVRTLGVPTIADRVAQTVVAERLGPRMEEIFHADSYGYRPRRSAIDAVRVCRQRCWDHDWVIDLDVAKFFDTCPHGDWLGLPWGPVFGQAEAPRGLVERGVWGARVGGGSGGGGDPGGAGCGLGEGVEDVAAGAGGGGDVGADGREVLGAVHGA